MLLIAGHSLPYSFPKKMPTAHALDVALVNQHLAN